MASSLTKKNKFVSNVQLDVQSACQFLNVSSAQIILKLYQSIRTAIASYSAQSQIIDLPTTTQIRSLCLSSLVWMITQNYWTRSLQLKCSKLV